MKKIIPLCTSPILHSKSGHPEQKGSIQADRYRLIRMEAMLEQHEKRLIKFSPLCANWQKKTARWQKCLELITCFDV